MSHTQESVQNGQTASDLILHLQAECQRLRQALAKAQEERDIYLQAVYAGERAKFRAAIRPEDVDFEEMEKASAGPVEFLE